MGEGSFDVEAAAAAAGAGARGAFTKEEERLTRVIALAGSLRRLPVEPVGGEMLRDDEREWEPVEAVVAGRFAVVVVTSLRTARSDEEVEAVVRRSEICLREGRRPRRDEDFLLLAVTVFTFRLGFTRLVLALRWAVSFKSHGSTTLLHCSASIHAHTLQRAT
jgi:hypothetical protein